MAQRRLNKSLVVVLVLGLMVVSTAAVIGLLLVYRGPEQEAAPYVEMALEHYRAGNYEMAAKAYAQAFLRTRDPAWLVAQGHAAREAGEAGAALDIWNRALSEDPGLIAAHEARIRLRLELLAMYPLPQQNVALRTASEALGRQSPDHPLSHFGLGMALVGLVDEDPGNMAKGIKEMETAQTLAPEDPEIAESLARVYEITASNHLREDRPKDAEEYRKKAEDILRGVIKADPESVKGYRTLAAFLVRRLQLDIGLAAMRRRKLDEAKKTAALKQIEENLLAARKRDPDDPDLGVQWAQYWYLSDKPEKALEVLQKITTTVPDFLDAYVILARRYYAERNPDKAVEVLEAGLAQKVNRFGYKGQIEKNKRFTMLCLACEIILGRASAEPEKRDEYLAKAEDWFNQAVAEKGATGWVIRQVKGQLREAQGKYREAQGAYRAVDGQLEWGTPNQQYKVRNLLRLARLYLRRLKAPGEAVKVLDSILEHRRAHPGARLLRGEAFLTMGKPEEAVDEAKRVLASAERLGDDHWAIRDARLLAMRGYTRLGMVKQVKALQEKLGGETPRDKLRQAIVYQLEKKNDKAAEVYKALLKDDPTNTRVLRQAIRFFASLDKRDEAGKLLQAAQAKKPDDPLLKSLALLLDEKLTEEQRNERFLELIKEQKDDLAREVSLCQYYLRQNDVPKALSHLEAARKIEPDDLALLEREFSLALRQKEWPRAERCWQQAVRLDADGAGGRFFGARITLTQAELERLEVQKLGSKDPARSRKHQEKARGLYAEAARRLREGIEIYDKSSNAHLWLGAAEEGLGNPGGARDAYTVAAELDPTNVSAHQALARLGMTYGNVPNVQDHLREAIRLAAKGSDGLPVDGWLRLQVENEREAQDPRSAVTRREEARKKDPKDVDNLMRLALLYERLEEFKKADACVAEALKAEPKDLILAWNASAYYRRSKQAAKAEALLRERVKQAEADEKWRAQAMVARHHVDMMARLEGIEPRPKDEYVKARNAADLAYEAAAKLEGAPAQVYMDAARFCERTDRRPEAIAWYRKALAIAGDKSYEAHIRQRVIRLLLASRPVPEDATKEVADYVKRFPGDLTGLMFRGELFAAQGKLAEAIEAHTAYLDQVRREGKGSSRSVRVAEALLLRGQLYLMAGRANRGSRGDLLRQAVRDLTQVKIVAPKNFRGLRHRVLLARAYELMGRYDQAVAELRAVLAQREDSRIAARELVRLYARLKRWPEQEALIRRQMNRSEKEWFWPFVLGTQFEQRGKTKEAAAALRKACELLEYKTNQARGTNQPVVLLLRVLSKTNQNREIIDTVKTKLRPEHRTSDVHSYYAGALAKTGKTAEALAAFHKAVLAVGSLDAYSRVARHMGASFGLAKAIKLLREEHAKQAGKSEAPALLLSTLLAYDNKRAEALSLVAQAVASAREPAKPLCLANQGMLLYEEGKHEKAVAAYTEVLKTWDSDLTVLNNLAYALAEDLKRPVEALPYAERAARLAPEDPSVLDTLGWCLFLMNRIQDASGVLLESVNRDPTLLDAQLHLAQVYAKDDRKNEAAGILRGALEDADERADEVSKARVRELMKELSIQ